MNVQNLIISIVRTTLRGIKRLSKAFSNLLKLTKKLPPTEKERTYRYVRHYVEPSFYTSGHLIKEKFEYPRCESKHVVLFSVYNGLQRYHCKFSSKDLYRYNKYCHE